MSTGSLFQRKIRPIHIYNRKNSVAAGNYAQWPIVFGWLLARLNDITCEVCGFTCEVYENTVEVVHFTCGLSQILSAWTINLVQVHTFSDRGRAFSMILRGD